MISKQQANRLRQLIQAYARTNSTDEFMVYVAGTDGMLDLSRRVIEQYDRKSDSGVLQATDRYCSAQGILSGTFLMELRKVLLALNSFHNEHHDHYATLGLPDNASKKMVKKAFRRLSKQYHPDTRQGEVENTQRFMEITGAYHAIMLAESNDTPQHTSPWRKDHSRRTKRPHDRKTFLVMVFALICLLGFATIFISVKYQKRLIFQQIQANEMNAKQAQMSRQQQSGPVAGGADRNNERPKPMPEKQEGTAAIRINENPRQDPPSVPFSGSVDAIDKNRIPRERNRVAMQPKPDRLPRTMRPPVPTKHPAQRKAIIESETEPTGKTHHSTETSSEEKSARIKKLNTSLEIHSLIDQYRTLYSGQELSPFLKLFSDHAKENGTPVADMSGKYQALFRQAQKITLLIDGIKWNAYRAGYLAEGKFKASYAYLDGTKSEHTGDIIFYLHREQGTLKIESLDYTFNE